MVNDTSNGRSRLRQELVRGWWILLVIATVLTLLNIDLQRVTPRVFAIVFGVNAVISLCIGGTIQLLYVVVHPRLPALGRVARWLSHGATVTFGVIVGAELALRGLEPFVNIELGSGRASVWKVGMVVSVIMAGIGISWDRLLAYARANELEAERAQQQLLRAQLENLQARLNPHFLFNSLNTVAALIEEEPSKAVLAVEQLSELLRYGLDGTQQPTVTLSRELAAVEDFLALEKLRFGDRLRWTVEVAPGAGQVEVPPLVLQPLVENAVKHGIASRRHGGVVTVSARLFDGELRLTVDDDGVGTSNVSGTNTGEANVRERLELAYGERARFESGPRRDEGYRVRLGIPLPEAA